MLMDMCLPKFNIYQGTVAPNYLKSHTNKSSQRSCSVGKAVFKNFAIFTGKHLCWNLFLTKLQTFKLFHRTPLVAASEHQYSIRFSDVFRGYRLKQSYDYIVMSSRLLISRGVFRSCQKIENN